MLELCNDMGLPERGRLKALSKQFGVSYQAAGKWISGESMPELEKAIAIADWGHVSVLWLLQGTLPKHIDKRHQAEEVMLDGINELPGGERQQVIDFVRYKFERADGWFTAEKLGRYMRMLDDLSKPPGSRP